MASEITYKNCKTLYTLRKNEGAITNEFVAQQSNVLDTFLMAGRITQEQYTELRGILTDNNTTNNKEVTK